MASLTAHAFLARIDKLTGQAREREILAALLAGHSPPSWQRFVTVTMADDGDGALPPAPGSQPVEVDVLCDYVAVGTDEDFVRVPMYPTTAQLLCDAMDLRLPTARMVRKVWAAAPAKLAPQPWRGKGGMASSRAYAEHDDMVRRQIAQSCPGLAAGTLLAGHKKDIVISPQVGDDNVVIYGWHRLSGVPIQAPNGRSHSKHYVDYSHGVRLVKPTVRVGGRAARYEDVLADPVLGRPLTAARLGPKSTRYPTR
jgi:hypothetical protein